MPFPSKAAAVALLALLFPAGASGQPAPGTDIWAFRTSGGTPDVNAASGIRVTDRPGYDNQPHFAPGAELILYTAIDSAGQADIWSFRLRDGESWNVTRSAPESEYSATVTPNLARFSVIRVEADSAQRLWTFESGGTNPEVLLPDVRAVGYHAWLTQDTLALFVLGEPATLQIASVRTGEAEVVARDIGRSIHPVPGSASVSFLQWASGGEGWITELDPETGEVVPIAPALEGNEYFAWTPGGVLVMGQGSKLFRWVKGTSGGWNEIADLEASGVREISRIAFSQDGRWVAVVGVESVDGG